MTEVFFLHKFPLVYPEKFHIRILSRVYKSVLGFGHLDVFYEKFNSFRDVWHYIWNIANDRVVALEKLNIEVLSSGFMVCLV